MRLPDPPAFRSGVAEERRFQRRYAVELEFECKPVGSEEVFLGKTSDMSSGGIRFHSQKFLPIGATLELRIKWPTPEDFALDLVMEGRVIRRDDQGTAVQVSRYAFGTRKKRAIRETKTKKAELLAG